MMDRPKKEMRVGGDKVGAWWLRMTDGEMTSGGATVGQLHWEDRDGNGWSSWSACEKRRERRLGAVERGWMKLLRNKVE